MDKFNRIAYDIYKEDLKTYEPYVKKTIKVYQNDEQIDIYIVVIGKQILPSKIYYLLNVKILH